VRREKGSAGSLPRAGARLTRAAAWTRLVARHGLLTWINERSASSPHPDVQERYGISASDQVAPCSLLNTQSESFMKTFNPLMLLLLIVAQSSLVQATDLNGAWSIDASACGAVFTKENNRIAFRKDADLNAGGLIVQGKQITGTFQKCTVKSLRDDGPSLQVVAACSDGVAISDVPFEVTMSADNKMTLNSKGPVPMSMTYFRCSM
jgi:hypothetical protein